MTRKTTDLMAIKFQTTKMSIEVKIKVKIELTKKEAIPEVRTVNGKCLTSCSFQINLDTISRKNLADLNVCSGLEEQAYTYSDF